MHAVCAPILWRGRGRLPVFCSETRVFHQKFSFSVQKRMFFVRNRWILFRNCSFSSEIAVFYQKTAVFHQKSLSSIKKLEFFIRFFRFLPKNCSFSSKIVVGCSETRVFHHKLLLVAQKLEFFDGNWRCARFARSGNARGVYFYFFLSGTERMMRLALSMRACDGGMTPASGYFIRSCSYL